MSNQLDKSIELAKWADENGDEQIVTIQKYLDLLGLKEDARNEIADFICQRLFTRYLKPFSYKDDDFESQYKNGFSIMANCCLLIETLQSFKNGWEDTKSPRSSQAFRDFFSTESEFSEFVDIDFYKNIRCGILHQGETYGGWKLNRGNKKGSKKPPKKLIDKSTKEINCIDFAKKLENSLKIYSEKLKDAEWNSKLWDNFRTKMDKIISNCKA